MQVCYRVMVPEFIREMSAHMKEYGPMAKKSKLAKKPKLTPAQIKDRVKKIQEIIEQQKRENKGEHFVSLTREEIEEKLKRANSPIITVQGWSDANPGGNVYYLVGIANPDPTLWDNLFVHVWVGSGNVDPVAGTFLMNVDTHFSRLTQPGPFGLGLGPGEGKLLTFYLNVPTGTEKTNYMGQSCLMRLPNNHIGQYLDRGLFVFVVH
jgi:hypothetical protein